MNFNFQAVDNMFEELETLSAKYSDYQGLPASKIEYGEARNQDDYQRAKKISKNYDIFIIIFFVIFAATTVGSFFTDAGFLVRALLIACTGIVGYVLAKTLFKETKVAYGKAIYKQKRLAGHIGTRRSARGYIYLITFIPDNGEKKLYTGVQISKREYEQIEEGTPVMVVNKGPRACIL